MRLFDFVLLGSIVYLFYLQSKKYASVICVEDGDDDDEIGTLNGVKLC